MIILLYLVTPTLGFMRNYIKYKRCDFKMFMRTPIVYFWFHILICLCGSNNIVLQTIIAERWYFFIEKSIRSYINNDYMKNKDKYIKKYGLKYN